MNFLSLIEAKRDGKTLSSSDIQSLVREFTAGTIPDYQMAAFLMAVFFRGLSMAETGAVTEAMRLSGEVLTWDANPTTGPIVDKHSTGGVGDKVSLPLAPLLAALGLRVPMISGRGLGITGGTLDKLESIPGFRTALAKSEMQNIVQDSGCVICGQTETMVPADKRLYALRDVTGTVPSIPLIVASIMSKKLAEGLNALVLDVKFGAAAFMRTQDDARTLAQAMVRIGQDFGVPTRALLTGMDSPLGRAAGNWLEVKEGVECLENSGPADLRQLVLAFAAHLLVVTEKVKNLDDAMHVSEQCLASGKAKLAWERMLQAQGARLDELQNMLRQDHLAPCVSEVRAPAAGFIAACDGRKIGELVRDLGGGRLNKDSRLDHSVGVDRLLKPGDHVSQGAILGRVHARTPDMARNACERLSAAFKISHEPPALPPLVFDVISSDPISGSAAG